MPEEAKPAAVLVEFARQAQTTSEIATAVADILQGIERTWSEMAYQCSMISDRCKAHGKANILAALPVEVAAALSATFDSTQAFWEANSPYQFPPMPEQPEAVEPEPQPSQE